MIIPNSINEVILSRIYELENETKDLLKIASVIGRAFFYRILTRVAAAIESVFKGREHEFYGMLAYRYIGYHAEAVSHFDRALRYLGLVLSTNKIVILLQILMFCLDLFKFFYFPSKKRKRNPYEREDLIINILLMSVSSSGMVGQKDLIDLFVQEAILTRKAVKLDLIKYPVLAEHLYNFDGYMALGGITPFWQKK